MEEKKEREKKSRGDAIRAHRDQRVGLVPGANADPRGSARSRAVGARRDTTLCYSFIYVFFFFFLSFNTLYIGLRDRGIAAAPAIDDRAGASLDPDSRRSISFVVRATIWRSCYIKEKEERRRVRSLPCAGACNIN